MQSDFKDSHERHWEDAELLYGNQRWANADHLYGMAVECGLKRLMIAFGMPFDSSRDMPQRRDDKKHADHIWIRYETYRSGHHQGAGYGLPSDNNPFDNWFVAQRYANRTNFDRARVNQHKQGANQVHSLLRKAAVEGLI